MLPLAFLSPTLDQNKMMKIGCKNLFYCAFNVDRLGIDTTFPRPNFFTKTASTFTAIFMCPKACQVHLEDDVCCEQFKAKVDGKTTVVAETEK